MAAAAAASSLGHVTSASIARAAGLDSDPATLQRFILTEQCKHPAASGDFSLLMSSIALACKATAVAVKKAGIAGLYGIEGVVNVQGEVAMLISEELPEPIVVPADRAGKYIVAFDPLDGSSNIECNVSIGSIFAIYERTTDLKTACDVEKDGLQAGTKLVAAGYCMYGAATVMVLCMGASVIASTLDPSLGEFIITNKDLRLPTPGKRIYSINEGNLKSMPAGVQAFVAECKDGAKPYSLRYVGSMVADVHRTLCYGGIFLYPATASSKSGKLRLLYEANPMAFLMEHAGGSASSGERASTAAHGDRAHTLPHPGDARPCRMRAPPVCHFRSQ
ncbi:unnamed protein product, partial [Symbiodinium sp. KB8]